jgi:hypothetical protein
MIFDLTNIKNEPLVSQPEDSSCSDQKDSPCSDQQELPCADTSGTCCGGPEPNKASAGGCGTGSDCCSGPKKEKSDPLSKTVDSVFFLVGSREGNAKKFATEISEYITAFNPGMKSDFIDVNNITIQQAEDIFTKESKNRLFVMIMGSYPDGEFCDNFRAYLEESATDWRIGRGHFRKTGKITRVDSI